MANMATGTTDTSGALSTSAKSAKSVLIVGEQKLAAGETSTLTKNTIFSISGNTDAKIKFGSDSIVSELVKILISNGVSNIKGMIIGTYSGATPDYPSKAEAYGAAFDESMKDRSVKCIALDVNDATVIARLKTHLDVAELEDMFRYSASAPDNITSDSVVSTFAAAINSKRIFVPSSDFVDASQNVLPGVYAGVGIISAIMTQTTDPALPLNSVSILGFGGVGRVLLTAQKTALVNAGVIPMYNDDNGNPTIFRLVTSYTKNAANEVDIIWQEGSTVFIADDVLETIENVLKAKYPRTKNVARVLDSIKTDVKAVLQNKEALEIIENLDVNAISVIKDPSDRYGALVDYQFDVVTPLYTITIKQHMVL